MTITLSGSSLSSLIIQSAASEISSTRNGVWSVIAASLAAAAVVIARGPILARTSARHPQQARDARRRNLPIMSSFAGDRRRSPPIVVLVGAAFHAGDHRFESGWGYSLDRVRYMRFAP